MRYQNNKENGSQYRRNHHSYRPCDAMTMNNEAIIKELVLPLAKNLLATGGYYAVTLLMRKFGISEEIIKMAQRAIR